MVTVSEILINLVKQKPFIEQALADGILNLSAFSRKIKPEIERKLKKQVTEASILMALKRLVPLLEVSVQRKIEKATRGFGDIIVRSNLSDFTYRNSKTLMEKQGSLILMLKNEKEAFYTISRGVYETTIVITSGFEGEVKHLFENEILLSSTSFISSLTIRLPKDNIKIPGLYYHVFKHVAWEGISILEAISTTNELTIIVKDKDVDRLFTVIKNLVKTD
jgi:hypothetical protein